MGQLLSTQKSNYMQKVVKNATLRKIYLKTNNMEIKSQIKSKWIELTIIEGNTKMTIDIWKNELESAKAILENVIQDIDYMIEKLNDK